MSTHYQRYIRYMLIAVLCVAAMPARTQAAVIGKPANHIGLVNGLIGHWTFDGADMSPNVRDRSGQGNHGNLIGQTATTTVAGKIGQAISFDGVDDYVSVPDVDMLDGHAAMSWSFWIYDDLITTGRYVLSKGGHDDGNAAAWSIVETTSNRVQMRLVNNIPTGSSDVFATISPKKWNHVLFVYDGTNITPYANGVVGTPVSFSGTLLNAARPVMFGNNYWLNYPGSLMLDDVRVYNRALSASEVQQLYAMGATKLGLSTPAASSLSSGLVGHWTFDGKDMSPNVRDISGQGNHGNLIGQTVTTTTFGKIGQALQFDGVNDYVRTGAIQTPSFTGTISMWVSRSSATNVNYLFDARGSSSGGTGYGYILANYGQNVMTNNGTIYINGTPQSGSNRINNDSWYHVVVSGITLDINQDFKIGSRLGGSETPWWGKIDDVRVYNRALSASEIKQLYAMGATKLGLSTPAASSLSSGLVGHWTFDGKDMGPNVRDVSGQGNHGNLIGQTATNTIVGKLGQALYFSSANDYVDSGTSPAGGLSGITVSTWVKIEDLNNRMLIEDGTSYTANAFYFYLNGGKPEFEIYVSNYDAITEAAALPLNQWVHLVGTWQSGTRVKLYVNGVASASSPTGSLQTGTLKVPDRNLHFGGRPAAPLTLEYKGGMDDVRIYNRALSASEVQQLYNMGR